jgi:hypothetical protein
MAWGFSLLEHMPPQAQPRKYLDHGFPSSRSRRGGPPQIDQRVQAWWWTKDTPLVGLQKISLEANGNTMLLGRLQRETGHEDTMRSG